MKKIKVYFFVLLLLQQAISYGVIDREATCSLRCVRDVCNGFYNKACSEAPRLKECVRNCSSEENKLLKRDGWLERELQAVEADLAALRSARTKKIA